MPKRDLPIKKRLFMLRQRYSIFFIALLFIISLAIPSVVAQISPSTPVIQAQENGRKLAQEAKEAYEIGNFNQSFKLWQEAKAAFVVSGEKLNQSMALSNLSLTYQQMGKWKDAQETIKRSLDILNESPKGKEHAKILAQTLVSLEP